MSARLGFRTIPLRVEIADAHTPLEAGAGLQRRTVEELEAENASLRARLLLAAERPAQNERRLAVLRCAAQGMTIAETARALYLCESSVKDAREVLIAALDARNITHVVHRAWEEGLLP